MALGRVNHNEEVLTMDRKGAVNLFVALALFVVFLAGCGGTESPQLPSSGDGETSRSVTIEGEVLAPGGQVAYFKRERGILYALGEYLIPSVHAGIHGLNPVPGATVELILVDDDGNDMVVLGETLTDSTGHYTLTYTPPAGMGINLIVRVRGQGNMEMRCLVAGERVDINPASEFVVRRILKKGIRLSVLSADMVVMLNGYVAGFDVTVTGGLSSIIDELESVAGEIVDEVIENLRKPEDERVAGRFHMVDFHLGLSSWLSYDPPLGGTKGDTVDLTLSVTRDDGRHNIHGMGTVFYAHTSPIPDGDNIAGYKLHAGTFGLELDDINIHTFRNRGFMIHFPLRETITENCSRHYPVTSWFYPLYDQGLLVVSSARYYTEHPRTTDNRCDTDTTILRTTTYSLGLVGAYSDGLTEGSIEGDYGVVGLGVWFFKDIGVVRVFGDHGVIKRSDGAYTFDPNRIVLVRTPNLPNLDVTLTEVHPGLQPSGTYEVEDDGTLTQTPSMLDGLALKGFVAMDGKVTVLGGVYNDQLKNGVANSTLRLLSVGIRLPEDVPDPSGKTYRLFFLNMHYEAHQGKTDISRFVRGVLALDNGNYIVRWRGSKIYRDNDRRDYKTRTEVDCETGTYTVEQGGVITFSGDDSGEDIHGYVGEDGSIMVVRVVDIDRDGENNIDDGSIGMVIAVESDDTVNTEGCSL